MSRATTQNVNASAGSETVIIEDCPCGKVHQVNGVTHYAKFILKCGRPVWALQPRRNGPLELRAWPGPALTARELKEKEARDEEGQNL